MKRLFTHNPGLKVLSVVLATVLWALLTGEKEESRVFSVPVDLVTPEEQVLSGEIPGSVSVSLRGSERLISAVDPGELRMEVDLRGGTVGEKRVVLDSARELKGVPPGLAVETISPQILTLRVERNIRRAVPVTPRVEGKPNTGCVYAGFDVVPTEVLVEGPESQVATLPMIRTERIDISGRCSPFVLSVQATPERPGVHLVTPRPVSVTLRIGPVGAKTG